MEEIVKECKDSMSKKIDSFERELSRVRTGRASVAMLDGIKVDYYGSPSPINQVASVSTPDARTIIISPFEKKLIPDLERAIQIADLGIQPVNDGNVIRLGIPALNEERRKEIAKSIKKLGEDAKVGVRKVRQEFNTKVKKDEKDKTLGEDESKELQKGIQAQTDSFMKLIDDRVVKKEKDILTL